MGQIKPQTKRPSKKPEHTISWGLVVVFLLFVFLALTAEWKLQPEMQLIFAIGAMIVFGGVLALHQNREILSELNAPIYIALLLACLLSLAGVFYGLFPKFALQQLFLNVGSLCIFICAYVAFRRNALNVYFMLRCLAITAATVSLISIELATSGVLLGLFQRLSWLFGIVLPEGFATFETNTRITTTLGNPNVFSPIALFGMMAGIIGFHKAGGRGGRTFQLALSVICGTAFVLCFSLGTILAYLATVPVIVITAGRAAHGKRLLEQIFCILASFIAASAVFALRDKSILPTLAVAIVAIGGGVLYTRFVPEEFPTLGSKLKKILLFGVPAVILLFAVCCLSFQGSYTLGRGESFRRAVALNPGSYTLITEAEGAALNAGINSVSYTDAALKETVPLASGTNGAEKLLSFIVPADSAAVFVTVSAPQGAVITSLKIVGTSETKVLPLKYRLLPEFIVNRLQGLWVNDNAIQRFVFFRDGVRLGLKSPIVGLGGGAFEGGIYSVADYNYQTKHSHNQLIESFAEGGILGTALFIALVIYSVRALRTPRKDETQKTLFPLLCAFPTIIFVHAMIEVDFIFPAYRVCAAVLLAMVAALSGDMLLPDNKRVKMTVKISLIVLMVATALLAFGRFTAVKMMERGATIQSLKVSIWLDPANRDDYMLSYLLGTMTTTDPEVQALQAKYLAAMNNHVYGLDAQAQFYLLNPNPDAEKGTKAIERYLRYERVNPVVWDAMFLLYNKSLDAYEGRSEDKAIVAASVQDTASYLTELNKTLPKQNMPKLAVFTVLRAESIELSSTSTGTVIDSRTKCDLDANGVSDILDISAPPGTIGWRLPVALSGLTGYTIRVYQDASTSCTVALDGNNLPVVYDVSQGCFVASTAGFLTNGTELAINITGSAPGAYFTVNAS